MSAEGEEAQAAVTESIHRLQELEAMVSFEEPDSDLNRLVEAAGKDFVPLHPEIYALLAVSQEYSRQSDGAWDVTAAPLVELWGIGTAKARVPAPQEIEQAKALVGWPKLLLRSDDNSAMLTEPGMKLDLGGIMKGLAIDEARKIYERHGITRGLINLGTSSLYAVGSRADGSPWRIGLRRPEGDDPKDYWGVVNLREAALSTSGDYERFFTADGERYHHIIDPRAGYPAKTNLTAVTIVVQSGETAGMRSDLLSTLVFVMGAEAGEKFLRQLPYSVQGVLLLENGRQVVIGDLPLEMKSRP